VVQLLSVNPDQGKRRFVVIYRILALFISLSVVQIQASPSARCPDVAGMSQEEQSVRRLELGKPIERELAGGQSHDYQLTLADRQYVNLVVDQRGIDVVVKLFGPDSKPIMEFDSESRAQGQESVSLVAEAGGSYRLSVQPKMNRAAPGRYEIRIEALRVATDDDRALYEARKLGSECVRLRGAAKYDDALPLAERALEIRQRVLGTNHRDVAAAISRLAQLYWDKGEYGKAEPLYERALAIWEKSPGPEHPDFAFGLVNFANLYQYKGDYEKAESLYRRALAILEKTLGPEHLHLALALNDLASIHFQKGEYEKAEPLYERSIAVYEKVSGPEDLALARPINNLAILYVQSDNYVKAEPLFQRAMFIKEKTLRADHRSLGSTILNLAILYMHRGDDLKAEQFYQRALAIWEKSLGPEHIDVTFVLVNLAELYQHNGAYAKAEPLLKRALAIREKVLEPLHPDLAYALNGLGTLYDDEGEYEKAEPLLKRALAIREKVLSEQHLELADSLESLAYFYLHKSDYPMAGQLYQRALAIKEKVLGTENPKVADSCHQLAVLYAARAEFAEAIKFQTRANAIRERNLAVNLVQGSDRQKLAFLALYSKETNFTLWLHARAAPNDPQALNLAITTLLRRKGRGLDAMTDPIAALRRRAAPQDQLLFDQLTEARSKLAMYTLKEPGAVNPDTYQARLRALEEKVEVLESGLSSRSAEFRERTQPVTLAAVKAALPADSVLVEFAICTERYLQTGKIEPPRYLVYLISGQGPPKWADLGEAAPIDRAIDAWRKALRDPQRTDVKRLARAVDDKVMRPVRSLIDELHGETRHLLIAPDGLLNLAPFAALVDEHNRYLVERYMISYLTSGRDLLRTPIQQPNRNAALIVANPDFGRAAGVGSTLAQNSETSRSDKQFGDQSQVKTHSAPIVFQPLPGTEGEATAIKTVLPEAKVLLWRQATETAIKQARAPRILHIATHGFFLSDEETLPAEATESFSEDPRRMSDLRLSRWTAHIKNPLLRSGLALARANLSNSGDDDGVLTAFEVAGLDLWGTGLVALSACDTGVGEVKNGDGVYGLRRALVLAGSEAQVMSLWPVSDRVTRELMVAYYKGLTEGQGRGEALRRVQLLMLKNVKRQHPFYWAAFIQSGEWANLEGRRQP
jgi:CHAT domain-containing protein/Tfp pilus assembly protein PilF